MVSRTPHYLSRLGRELTDSLRVIAYTDKCEDLEFIRERQADLRRDYEHKFFSDPSLATSGNTVIDAYRMFMRLLETTESADISDACRDILDDYLRKYT